MFIFDRLHRSWAAMMPAKYGYEIQLCKQTEKWLFVSDVPHYETGCRMAAFVKTSRVSPYLHPISFQWFKFKMKKAFIHIYCYNGYTDIFIYQIIDIFASQVCSTVVSSAHGDDVEEYW